MSLPAEIPPPQDPPIPGAPPEDPTPGRDPEMPSPILPGPEIPMESPPEIPGGMPVLG
jgi:hypothetical protein